MPTNTQKTAEEGFALLMTIVVVSVIISIGLTVLDLSIKQIRLSTNAKDSEIAFNAANSGIECAQYWRRENSDEMERGQVITPRCFNVDAGVNTVQRIENGVEGTGEVFQYQYEFTWDGLEPRCTRINTLVASSTPGGTGLRININTLTTLIPGYPVVGDRECNAGEQCTVVSVQGYNRSCATITGFGTVQREVLLQF